MLTDLKQDLRYGGRVFVKQPGFAAAAVLTLALGIAATTAVFSVVYGVLLKPLPFREPDRLVSLLHRSTVTDIDVWNHGPATFFTYHDHSRAFEAIGAWESNEVSISGRGEPEQVEVLAVTNTTLPILGVQPLIGRLFNAEDDSPGRPLRAILTHAYWQRRFGGAADVIGKTLLIDGAAAEIVGVLPASFNFLRTHPSVLLPIQLDRATATGIEFDFQALARLKPGVTLAQVNADIGRMIRLLPQPFERLHLQPYVRPLADDVVGDVTRVLWILMAAVGVVLLIACGNVANLFLIRAEARQQELATRAALGASRARLARVILSESVLLALAGGVVGVVLAEASLVLLRAIAPARLPRIEDIAVDGVVLSFALIVCGLSGALCGLFAVLRFGAPRVGALRDGGRAASDAPARHRTRNALVVVQIALALVLLIVSALMTRTFVAMRQVQPGFSAPEDVQTFRLAIPAGVISDADAAARTYQAVAERLAHVRGVQSVGISSSITMDGEDNGNPVDVEGFPSAAGVLPPLWRFKSFAPGYFETMGNPLVAGRSITWEEIHQRRLVVVVSEALARRYWREPVTALGKRIRGGPDNPWREIVGVVGNERDDGLNHPPTPIVYWPLVNESYQRDAMAYVVRSRRAGTATFLREVQQAVWSVNPNLPVAATQTLVEIQAHSMAQTSFAMVMLAISASVALLLGVVGIYGVIAYAAAQRTREVGIRIALGAQLSDVRQLFLRYGLRLTAIGIGLGAAAALAVTRLMSTLLFGVGPMDPITYFVVSASLALVALVATYLPARRASRVDPVVALRAEH